MALERRRDERKKRRLTCRVGYHGQYFRGIVLDLSATGLFVQTTTPIPPGSTVVVELQGQDETFEVAARVARRRRVPQRLASVMPAGIGLRVVDCADAYQRLVRREGSGDAKPASPESAPVRTKYRVRVTQRGSSRSRTLVLQAANEAELRSRVVRDLGTEWDLMEFEAT